MIGNQLGDLSRGMLLRQSSAALKGDLDRLSREMATGVVADPRGRLSGDVGALASIEQGLKLGDAWREGREAAGAIAGGQQRALGQFQHLVDPLGVALLEAATSGTGPSRSATLSDLASRFGSAVAALNGDFAGRSLFAGAATRSAALAEPDDILSALSAALAGATTADDVMAAAEAFFLSPGTGFDSAVYLGSDEALAPIALDRTARVTLDVTAAAPELRAGLMHFAVGALMADGLLAADPVEQTRLLEHIGTGFLRSQSEVVDLRGRVGSAEARIEEAAVRSGAMRTALELARAELIGADPYETASRLEQARLQLETVYTITARLSGLTLARALR